MLTRRTALTAGCALPAFALPTLLHTARAQETDLPAEANLSALRELGFIGPEDDPDFGSSITGVPESPVAVGEQRARHDEVAKGLRYLFDAPRGVEPIAVARYFEGLTDSNADEGFWNAEWKTRANPVIVGFFGMTQTLPSSGDQTAWCAAFVNFCLYASGKTGTASALSGSFRKYGDSVSDAPQPGDIAVFSKRGELGRKGFGHVAFFVSQSGDTVKILGGNQRGDTGTKGAVVTWDFPVEGADLFLVDIRRGA